MNLRRKSGEWISSVFVVNGHEIVGIYDRENFDFKVSEIEDVEIVSPDGLPSFDEKKWLRLDIKS